MGEFKLLYTVAKDFGALSVGMLSLLVNIWFIWKLFTNHLHHIQLGIDENKENISLLTEKMSMIEKDVVIIKATFDIKKRK